MGPGNRPLDLDWLEDFMALAETGNFTRAAEARAIAQPAFSRHIRSLEEWVGVELFDRGTHQTVLTAAGRRIHPLLRETIAGLEAARIKARIAHDQAAASLRIATTHELSLAFFPRWLASVESRMRAGPVHVATGDDAGCEEAMLQRRVQFLLGHAHADAPGRLDDGSYPTIDLGDDALVPVSAPEAGGRPRHELDRGGPLPVLEYGESSRLGRILRASFRDAFGAATSRGPSPSLSVVLSAHDAPLLERMALEGRGLAWLPRSLVGGALAEGRLVPAGNARWEVPLRIRLYRQPQAMAPVAEALWRVAGGG